MSHIPSSKMPHARPHEELDEPVANAADETAANGARDDAAMPDDAVADGSAVTTMLGVAPATLHDAASAPPEPRDDKSVKQKAATPLAAIATVAVLAIGGIATAIALRRPEPAKKRGGGAKGKARSRKSSKQD